MNYLQICQFVQRFLAAGNDLPENPMTTTVAQTGLNYEITQWVKDSYKAIQSEQEDWLFRTKQGLLSLPNGTLSITKTAIQALITDYERQLFFIFPTSSRYLLTYLNTGNPSTDKTSASYCYYIPYQRWRGWRDRGVIPDGMPQYFTILPNQGLEFYPRSDSGSLTTNYIIEMDYYTIYDQFTIDNSAPIFPTEYHEAIAWYAIYYWGLVRQSGPRFQTAKAEYERVMNDMRHSQLPEQLLSLTEFNG